MKKGIALVALSLLMAGCVSNGKVSVSREQLQHHRFVLESVDGQPVAATPQPAELSFGEKMTISGKMCNRFTGQATLSDGELKAKGLAMTRMLCTDSQLNALDTLFSTLLEQGAQVDLTANQLTLATAEHTLSYKLADVVQ